MQLFNLIFLGLGCWPWVGKFRRLHNIISTISNPSRIRYIRKHASIYLIVCLVNSWALLVPSIVLWCEYVWTNLFQSALLDKRLVQGERPNFIKESEVHAVFRGDRSWKLHTCSMSPCRPVAGRFLFCFVLFLSQIFVLLKYVGLKESQIPDEKKKTRAHTHTHAVRQRVDRDL